MKMNQLLYKSAFSPPCSHIASDTSTSNMTSTKRLTVTLGRERCVEVCEWKGELRVDLREWQDGKPTKKGISLPLMRWKNWVDYIEYVDEALREKKTYKSHLGGNVYCSITESGCVDIRQYWRPESEVVPTKKGLCLRPSEYETLKGSIPTIGQVLPELNSVVPCYTQTDHLNQLGFLKCMECNPDDHMNW